MLKEFTALRMMQGPGDAAGLDLMQRQLQTCLKDLYGVEITKGRIVEVTFPSFANNDISVKHGLGRVPTGFVTVQISTAAIIYNSSTVAAAPKEEIILRANVGDVITKLWIF